MSTALCWVAERRGAEQTGEAVLETRIYLKSQLARLITTSLSYRFPLVFAEVFAEVFVEMIRVIPTICHEFPERGTRPTTADVKYELSRCFS